MKGFSKIKVLALLSIALIVACGKDEQELEGFLTPIMITLPSTNPTEAKTNTPINFAATFTTDTIIDSVRVKYIVDSTNIGNNEDSLKYLVLVIRFMGTLVLKESTSEHTNIRKAHSLVIFLRV
jgi:hypothetical protein